MYELLGVKRSSPQSKIKAVYRSLQKRCHPDVWSAPPRATTWPSSSTRCTRCSSTRPRASPTTTSRRAAPSSPGLDPDTVARAVFIDKVRCVGCLKCALHASRTTRTGSPEPSAPAPSTASRWSRGRTWQLSSSSCPCSRAAESASPKAMPSELTR